MANKHYKKLSDLVTGLGADFEKFYDKSNNAAGTRVRKGMQDLKTLAQQIRLDVQNIKNKAAASAKPKAKATAKKK